MKGPKRKPLRIKKNESLIDPGIEFEDLEIKRLEKLLGISQKKKRKLVESKLNAEFEKEGIGSDFGSFLFELDDLTNRVSRVESNAAEGKSNLEKVNESEVIPVVEIPAEKPLASRSIYGDQSIPKYVPPAKRFAETSNEECVVHRTVTSLLNKLSESNKDNVLRELIDVYDHNSNQLTNAAIFHHIFVTYKDSVQKLPSVCLLHAGLVGALSLTIGSEVVGFMLEKVFECFRDSTRTCVLTGGLTTKLPHNMIILLCSLYGLRLLHHRLISDMLLYFAKNSNLFMCTNDLQIKRPTSMELRLDFLELLAHFGGEFLRVDDPVNFQSSLDMAKEIDVDGPSCRLQFILETLNNIRMGSVKNKQFQESVRIYRKWLGTVKSSFPRRKSEAIMNISLSDLMNVEAAGRWWMVGASWRSNLQESENNNKESDMTLNNTAETQDLVETAAAKMKLLGGNKKLIFRVLMSSRDVIDAFESLLRLDLKGKGDRDIVRVLCECCSHETPYNPFYAEISKLLCEQSRQAKITFQFVIWDSIKSWQYGMNTKHITNLSKFCVELVVSFHLPLIFLKIFSIADLFDSDIRFLVLFFQNMFSSEVEDTVILDAAYRIATSSDFSIVRDLIMFILKTHMKEESNPLINSRKRKFLKGLHEMKVLDMNE